MTDKSLNSVFTFTDALEAVQEMLNQQKDERDSYGPVEGTGLYNNWDAYYIVQDRVNVLQDVLDDLTNENAVRYYIAQGADREFHKILTEEGK